MQRSGFFFQKGASKRRLWNEDDWENYELREFVSTFQEI